MSKIEVDIKKDSVFKNIFLREEGRVLMCNIISDLYNIDVSLLISNLKYYNGEYP